VSHWVPELLCPAGSFEKLKVAVLYGADAVYLAGQQFGLRSAADNFTHEELFEAVDFAHKRGTKVYVVLNSFLYDKELLELPEFLKVLEKAKVDAVIVSDLGVVSTVKEKSNLIVHLSTQASCLNSYAAKLWQRMGVTRVVLGREVSIKEAAEIKQSTGLEVEMFIHGSMCMAYSGNCVISNYTQGRDSNRGGCAHSCRFEYSFEGDKQSKERQHAYFMSSKDLAGLRLLEEFVKEGIDSLKIEGRMKAHHYAATVSKVYSEALSFYRKNGNLISEDIFKWEAELGKIGHRAYHSGSLDKLASVESIYDERDHEESEYRVAGVVLERVPGHYLLVQVKNPFYFGDELEVLPFEGNTITYRPSFLKNIKNEEIEKTKPGTLIKIPDCELANPFNIVRHRRAPNTIGGKQ
jgi:U32 family peptidase